MVRWDQERKAAVKIQAVARGIIVRLRAQRQVPVLENLEGQATAALKIQTAWRRKLALKDVDWKREVKKARARLAEEEDRQKKRAEFLRTHNGGEVSQEELEALGISSLQELQGDVSAPTFRYPVEALEQPPSPKKATKNPTRGVVESATATKAVKISRTQTLPVRPGKPSPSSVAIQTRSSVTQGKVHRSLSQKVQRPVRLPSEKVPLRPVTSTPSLKQPAAKKATQSATSDSLSGSATAAKPMRPTISATKSKPISSDKNGRAAAIDSKRVEAKKVKAVTVRPAHQAKEREAEALVHESTGQAAAAAPEVTPTIGEGDAAEMDAQPAQAEPRPETHAAEQMQDHQQEEPVDSRQPTPLLQNEAPLSISKQAQVPRELEKSQTIRMQERPVLGKGSLSQSSKPVNDAMIAVALAQVEAARSTEERRIAARERTPKQGRSTEGESTPEHGGSSSATVVPGEQKRPRTPIKPASAAIPPPRTPAAAKARSDGGGPDKVAAPIPKQRSSSSPSKPGHQQDGQQGEWLTFTCPILEAWARPASPRQEPRQARFGGLMKPRRTADNGGEKGSGRLESHYDSSAIKVCKCLKPNPANAQFCQGCGEKFDLTTIRDVKPRAGIVDA
eukprot:TRINITY_DN31864_c1_g1_i1.p1 TRINITY_DN31864_c1_g1~~TRINITY_DN31864_c1_g1_i1.p1  ORF type:complete len:620 (+),score=107.81 TRINITY_DN31864_c1_g1_i1:149-2008(+)